MTLAARILNGARSSRLAVVGEHESWTYGDLVERIDDLTGRLRASGVGPGDLVVVHGGRSARTVAAKLAALRLGAGLVPIDTSAPETRLEAATRICRPRAVVDIGRDEVRPGHERPAHYDRPGHVVFTSGSTGDPKAILVGEPALLNHAEGFRSRLDLTPRDRVLHCTGIDFDVAAEEIWPTLLAGATVVVLEQPLGTVGYPDFMHVLDERRVTVCNLPASYFRGWTAAIDRQQCLPDSLRAVIAGSETVPVAAAARWLELPRPPLLFNAYGVSEATITSLVHEVVPGSLRGDSVPVGKPLAGVTARVVDKALREVHHGVKGELLLGGDGIAEGYLDPATSMSAFVELDGARWYRTGDRAALRDGEFYHYGRLDDQLKIRGHRIEPTQVSAVLARVPSVVEAVTYVVDDLLVASYQSLAPIPTDDLVTVLRRALPTAEDRTRAAAAGLMRQALLHPAT